MSDNDRIFELQAKLCKAMGQATRLKIVNFLKAGPQCVTSIAESIEITQSSASRHLGYLSSAGIVIRSRKAREVFYEISSPKIVEVCDLMREVLKEKELHFLEIFEISKE